MCKKLIAIAVILLMAGIVQAKDWIVSLAGNDNSLTGRIGYKVAEPTEIGMEIAWLKLDDAPMVFGAYGLYKFADVNVPNPIDIDWLPDNFTGTPYVGVETGLNLNNKGTFVSPLAGFRLGNLFCEYKYVIAGNDLEDVDNTQELAIGILFEF
jgi:hypothetical protein